MFKRNSGNGGNVWVAVAIIIAGLIIAAAVMFSGNGGGVSHDPNAPAQSAEEALAAMRDIQDDDHIKGNKDAKITIVEFSDTECPFCKTVHQVLDQIVEKYDGQVAWVYRHMPLTQLHKKAVIEAHATECATEQGGNDAFWAYADRLYEVTPSNDGLNLDELPNIAEFVGLDRAEFETCMENEGHLEAIEEDFREGVATASASSEDGRFGTPFSVVITESGERFTVSGVSRTNELGKWEGIIDELLAQ